jgi:hypothetical protein
MVKQVSPLGLIATARADVTPPLDDVVRSCGWPLVLEANPRRLAQEFSLHNPECVLFWLEERQHVPTLARLIGWSRERGARPYRLAVAYRLDADVEAILREAGAHTFVSVGDRSALAVAAALRSLYVAPAQTAGGAAAGARPRMAPREPAETLSMPFDLARPP